METIEIKKRTKRIWFFLKRMSFSLPLVVLSYFVLRLTLGLSKYLIFGYAFLLLALGIPIETISLVFFLMALVAYIFGGWLEANHYFSYVYIGLILTVIKYFYLALKDRKIH